VYEVTVVQNKPETIHTQFCRKLLYVKKSTNLNAMYGELGRVPMFIQRKIQMIKYWAKVLSHPETTILYKTYTLLKTKVDIGCADNNNWAYQIKLILHRSDCSNIWLLQHTSPFIVNIIKTRILDDHYQLWYTNINNASKLETYCLSKHTFDLKSIWIL